MWSAGRRLLRLAHEDGRVVGFNAMGLRWRHRVAEAWIDEGREVPWVIEHLADAGFDGELEPRHEAAMAAELGRQYGAVEVS